jgi:hypothetical protein
MFFQANPFSEPQTNEKEMGKLQRDLMKNCLHAVQFCAVSCYFCRKKLNFVETGEEFSFINFITKPKT